MSPLALAAFVGFGLVAAMAEWVVRKELRRARTWAIADIVIYEDKCYGLSDENNQPLADSPPLSELPAGELTSANTRTVLYDPHNPTFFKDIRHFRLAQIKR